MHEHFVSPPFSGASRSQPTVVVCLWVSEYRQLAQWPQISIPVLHSRSARCICHDLALLLNHRRIGIHWRPTSCRAHFTFRVSRNTNPVDDIASFLISYRPQPATLFERYWKREWKMQHGGPNDGEDVRLFRVIETQIITRWRFISSSCRGYSKGLIRIWSTIVVRKVINFNLSLLLCSLWTLQALSEIYFVYISVLFCCGLTTQKESLLNSIAEQNSLIEPERNQANTRGC